MKLLIKTQRLILKPVEIEDYGVWVEAQTNQLPPQNKFDRGGVDKFNLNKKHFKNLVKREKNFIESKNGFIFGIFLKKSGVMIGRVGIEITKDRFFTGFLGYTIYNNYWGQGFGTEAVNSVINWILKNNHVHRIEANVELTNRRSIRLLKSLGLRKEGIKKNSFLRDEKFHDVTVYATTSEEKGFAWKNKL